MSGSAKAALITGVQVIAGILFGSLIFGMLLIPGYLAAWAIGWPLTIIRAFALDLVAVAPLIFLLGVLGFLIVQGYRQNRDKMSEE